MIDPLAVDPLDALERRLDPLARLGFGSRQRKQARFPVLSPEEEQGYLSHILGAGASGLELVGNVLDTPGSLVRGLLDGDPGRAFGGLLDPEQRVSGRELLEDYGMLGANTEGLDFGDVAGFGAEVVTDPLSLLTFGGLTAAGKAAQLEGKLVKGLGAGIKSGQRSAVGVGLPLPFGGDPLLHLGASGSTPERFYTNLPLDDLGERDVVRELAELQGPQRSGKPLDLTRYDIDRWRESRLGDLIGKGEEAVKYSAPVRWGRALLDSSVGGAVAKEDQQVQEALYYARTAGGPLGKEKAMKYQSDLTEVATTFGEVYEAQFTDTPKPASLGPFNVGDVVQATDRGNYGTVIGAGNGMLDVFFKDPVHGSTARRQFSPEELKLRFAKGEVPAGEYAREMTRNILDRIVRFAADTGGNVDEAFATIAPEMGMNVPLELKEQVHSLVADIQSTLGASHQSLTGKGMRGGVINEVAEEVGYFPSYVNREPLERAGGRSVSIATDSSKARDPITRTVPREIVNRMLQDQKLRPTRHEFRTVGGVVKQVKAKVPIDMESDAVRHLADTYGRYLPDNVDAKQAYQWVQRHSEDFANSKLDLYSNPTVTDVTRNLVQAHQADAMADKIHDLFWNSNDVGGVDLRTAYSAVPGMDPDRAMQWAVQSSGKSADELNAVRINPRLVEAVKGTWKAFDEPEWAKGVGKAIDSTTSVIKESLTQPWPAHHFRNLTGGMYLNATAGMVSNPKDLAALTRNAKEVWSMRKAPDPELLREMEAYGVIDQRFDRTGVEMLRGREGITPGSPLNFKENARTASDYVDQHPSSLAGLLGAKAGSAVEKTRKGYNTVMATGAALGEQVEWVNRASYYKYLKEKGFTPAAAAEEVKRVQFSYRDRTDFERKVAGRLFPFWSFSKKVMPLTVKTLASKPGGAMAQTIRGANTFKDDAPYTPGYIGEGVGAYLGEDRFLSKLGLPFEDPLSRVVVGPTAMSTFGRTVEKNIASMHPALTLGYSLASGKEPYFGKDLTDMPPYPSNNLFANALIGKSPASRAVSSFRTLDDDQKGWGDAALNLLTGLDVTHVRGGLDVAKERDAMRAIDTLLRENPDVAEFKDFYVPKGAEPDEETELLMRLQSTLDKNRKERKKKPKVDDRS